MSAEATRRSLVSRLRERNGEGMPHVVVCGSDALVYTLAEELASAGHRIRITVVVPQPMRSDVPDLTRLRGVRVVPVERLDEETFRSVGLSGADALGLVMPDDVVNLHAALCAQAVEPNLRLVIRLVNTALGQSIRSRLGEDSTTIAALCDGTIGYICTADAYEVGGYEPNASVLRAGEGERIADAIVALASPAAQSEAHP